MKKSHRSKKLLLSLVAVAALLAVAGFFAYQKYSSDEVSQVIDSGPTPEQKKQEADANTEAKRKAIEGNDQSSNTQPAVQNSSDSIILSAQQESNNTVTVFTRVASVSSGTCTLEITNAGQQTTQTAEVIYQPEYSSCAGFSVPISSVGKGTWTVKLTVSAGGTTASNAITYEVR